MIGICETHLFEKEKAMFTRLLAVLIATIAFALAPLTANAQDTVSDRYTSNELVAAGGQFFGSVSQGLASVVERAVSNYGLPNGYILGQEGSGAIFGGVKYGEGELYTKNAGNHILYWQGPTLGFDIGADGSQVMMLVYNLPSTDSIYGRYPGVDGSAYVVGGIGMTVMKYKDIYLVPIRSGVGARLGVNVGYLKFTKEPTWNPF